MTFLPQCHRVDGVRRRDGFLGGRSVFAGRRTVCKSLSQREPASCVADESISANAVDVSRIPFWPFVTSVFVNCYLLIADPNFLRRRRTSIYREALKKEKKRKTRYTLCRVCGRRNIT